MVDAAPAFNEQLLHLHDPVAHDSAEQVTDEDCRVLGIGTRSSCTRQAARSIVGVLPPSNADRYGFFTNNIAKV